MTAFFLIRRRPEIVWFQFSLALGVVLALYTRLRHGADVELVADIHTKALKRNGGGLQWLILPIKRWALRSCTTILVTNRHNAAYAERTFGTKPLVLADPLPTPGPGRREHSQDGPDTVVFVCSFAPDEPLDLIREVAAELTPAFDVAITGNPSSLEPETRARLSEVARLTGFLPDREYWSLLEGSRAIVVLTTEEACLPCGAYEAIATGHRPVLLEDRSARELYGALALFCQPYGDAVVSAILEAAGPAGRVSDQQLREFEQEWDRSWQCVHDRIAPEQAHARP